MHFEFDIQRKAVNLIANNNCLEVINWPDHLRVIKVTKFTKLSFNRILRLVQVAEKTLFDSPKNTHSVPCDVMGFKMCHPIFNVSPHDFIYRGGNSGI